MTADEVDELIERVERQKCVEDAEGRVIFGDFFSEISVTLRALRKDRERLDWVELKQGYPIKNCGKWCVAWAREDGMTEWESVGPDLRSAVDAAMAAESARGEGE